MGGTPAARAVALALLLLLACLASRGAATADAGFSVADARHAADSFARQVQDIVAALITRPFEALDPEVRFFHGPRNGTEGAEGDQGGAVADAEGTGGYDWPARGDRDPALPPAPRPPRECRDRWREPLGRFLTAQVSPNAKGLGALLAELILGPSPDAAAAGSALGWRPVEALVEGLRSSVAAGRVPVLFAPGNGTLPPEPRRGEFAHIGGGSGAGFQLFCEGGAPGTRGGETLLSAGGGGGGGLDAFLGAGWEGGGEGGGEGEAPAIELRSYGGGGGAGVQLYGAVDGNWTVLASVGQGGGCGSPDGGAGRGGAVEGVLLQCGGAWDDDADAKGFAAALHRVTAPSLDDCLARGGEAVVRGGGGGGGGAAFGGCELSPPVGDGYGFAFALRFRGRGAPRNATGAAFGGAASGSAVAGGPRRAASAYEEWASVDWARDLRGAAWAGPRATGRPRVADARRGLSQSGAAWDGGGGGGGGASGAEGLRGGRAPAAAILRHGGGGRGRGTGAAALVGAAAVAAALLARRATRARRGGYRRVP